MRRGFALAVTVLAVGFALAPRDVYAEGWLCVAEQSAGFKNNPTMKKWESTRISTDRRYIIRRPTDSEYFRGAPWVVAELKGDYAIMQCNKEINSGYLYCEGTFTQFRFRTDTLRFLLIHPFGFWIKHADWVGADIPYMEIGACSPI